MDVICQYVYQAVGKAYQPAVCYEVQAIPKPHAHESETLDDAPEKDCVEYWRARAVDVTAAQPAQLQVEELDAECCNPRRAAFLCESLNEKLERYWRVHCWM